MHALEINKIIKCTVLLNNQVRHVVTLYVYNICAGVCSNSEQVFPGTTGASGGISEAVLCGTVGWFAVLPVACHTHLCYVHVYTAATRNPWLRCTRALPLLYLTARQARHCRDTRPLGSGTQYNINSDVEH